MATQEKRMHGSGSLANFVYRETKQRFVIEQGEQFPRDL